jgi:hypothetical protein
VHSTYTHTADTLTRSRFPYFLTSLHPENICNQLGWLGLLPIWGVMPTAVVEWVIIACLPAPLSVHCLSYVKWICPASATYCGYGIRWASFHSVSDFDWRVTARHPSRCTLRTKHQQTNKYFRHTRRTHKTACVGIESVLAAAPSVFLCQRCVLTFFTQKTLVYCFLYLVESKLHYFLFSAHPSICENLDLLQAYFGIIEIAQ